MAEKPLTDKLQDLHNLYKSGALTEEEYNSLKKKLISSSVSKEVDSPYEISISENLKSPKRKRLFMIIGSSVFLLFIMLVVFFFANHGFKWDRNKAVEPSPSDLILQGLNGKVKSIIESKWYNGVVGETHFDELGRKTYFKKDNIIDSIVYGTNGMIEKTLHIDKNRNKITDVDYYFYNKNKTIKEIYNDVVYNLTSKEYNELIQKNKSNTEFRPQICHYYYDRKGRLIQQDTKGGIDSIRFKYNTSGKLIEIIGEGRDAIDDSAVMKYNGNGALIEKSVYQLYRKSNYYIQKYNSDNKVIEEVHYMDGEFAYKFLYTYNDKDLLEERILINNSGEGSTRYEYIYDDYGNWIKKKHIADYVTDEEKRIIDYYVD